MRRLRTLGEGNWSLPSIGMVGLPHPEDCTAEGTDYYQVAWDIAVPTHPLCNFLVCKL